MFDSGEKKEKIFDTGITVVLTIIVILNHILLTKFKPALIHYAVPICFLFLGAVRRRRNIGKTPAFCGLLLIFWYLLSSIINGDIFLEKNIAYMGNIVLCWGFAFTFGFVTRSNDRKIYSIAAVLFLLSVFVLSVLSIKCALTNTTIELPEYKFLIGINEERRMNAGANHPNTYALFLFLAIMLANILFYRWNSKILKAVLLVMAAFMYVSIGLTVSRTVMIMCAAVGMIEIYVLGLKHIDPRRLLNQLLLISASAAIGAVLYFGFQFSNKAVRHFTVQNYQVTTSEMVVDRPINKQEFSSLNGRKEIYINTLQYLFENPRVLLFGERADRWKASFQQYVPKINHAHNSYLQMTIISGIPGLLCALYVTYQTIRAAWIILWKQRARYNMEVCTMVIMLLGLLLHTLVEVHMFSFSAPEASYVFFLTLGTIFREIEESSKADEMAV